MSFQVSVASVQQYTTNLQALLQQKGSRLRNAVTVGSYTGKSGKAVEQIGAVIAQKVNSRHSDTPLISTPHDARWVFPEDYSWADMIDDIDKLRMLIDPTSAYALNGANALGRAMDDVIIAAFNGTSKTGENGTVSTTLPAGNVVAVGTSGMTVAKLRVARKILMANEVDLDTDPLFCTLTAAQNDDLIGQTQVVSSDFNVRRDGKPVLSDGNVVSFLGFNFIHTERVPLAGTTRSNFAWAKSGMHMGIWNDISGSVDRRPDKNNNHQVLAKGTFGATRVEEGKVIQIDAVE